MTETAEARRSERVHYRGPVELFTRGGVDDLDAVHAEAVDLGPGGMRVCAPVRVPVGAHVTCRVALDGRDAALPGRVAWLEHGDDVHGIGICFDPLGSDEAALLQHVVERSRGGYRSIELHFPGVGPSVLARARARTNGLRLSAVLPILARGTELSFRLDEEGPQFRGRIADASLHEEDGGARRLEVDVDVQDSDGVRFRRRARYGYADEIQAAEQTVTHAAPAAVQSKLRTAADALRTARSRPAKLAALLLAATCGALLGWSAARLPPAVAAQRAPAAMQREPAKALAATTGARRAVAPATATSAMTVTPAGVVRDAPAPETPPTAPALPAAFEDGDVTRVLVPFEGDLDQMQARMWADPFALAVDLPHGRVLLAEGTYPLHAGTAADLRVQRRGSVELIRLKLSVPLARYAVALQNGTLELRLVRHPAVAPNP